MSTHKTRSLSVSHRPLQSRGMILWFMLANLVGWALGWALGASHGEVFGGFISYAMGATLSSVFEWPIIRSVIRRTSPWVAATGSGIVVGALLSKILMVPLGVPLLILFQSITFSREIRAGLKWLIGGLLGVVFGGGVGTVVYLTLGGEFGTSSSGDLQGPWVGFLLGGAFGLLFGAAKGLALHWIRGRIALDR